MIRFRLGQSWKHEGGDEDPSDALSLELDGVDILAGAHDEPLLKAVPAVIDAVSALVLSGERVAQASFSEAELELCMMRRADSPEVELSVLSMGRAPRVEKGPLRIDLLELGQAAARCAETLLRDVKARAPAQLRQGRMSQLPAQARKLSAAQSARAPAELDPGAWSHIEPARPGVLGFRLLDPVGRMLCWKRRGAAPLPALLVEGEVNASDGRRENGLPLLWVLDACRRASAEPESKSVVLAPGIEAPPAEIFNLGLRLCFAMSSRNAALGSNPYLEALAERCRDGLSSLRQPTPLQSVSGAKSKKPRGQKRLPGHGSLRRLRFATRWEKETPGLEGEGQLRLGAKGPLVVTQHAAMGIHTDGRVLYRRVEVGGLCVSDDGRALVSHQGRLLFFEGTQKQARWIRDYEGPALVGPLHRVNGGLVISLAHRGVASFSELTGAELWRVDPPRAQAGHVGVHGERVLLATDTGALLGLDASSGVTRFRIRASLPFTTAPVAAGRTLLALLARGERSALICADLAHGTLAWSKELSLEKPSAPAIYRGRVLLAGRRAGSVYLGAFSRRGEALWERALPLTGSRLFTLALSHGTLVQDSRGAAVMVSSDGHVEWVQGTAAPELPHPLPPVHARGVIILAGETVRALDPRSGRALAEVQVGPALTALAADRQLNLYLLMENGLLRALKLVAQLSVV